MVQLFLVILLVVPGYAVTLKQPEKDYSADFLMKVTQGQDVESMTIPGKIYYSKGKERRETEMMGHKSISIRRDDKKLFWILMPEQRMYMEHSLVEQQQEDPTAALYDGDMEIIKLGQEKVNGVMTDKYQMTMTDPQEEPIEGFIWLSKENVPIRLKGTSQEENDTSHFTLDTTNLKFSPQPLSLFEVPADYQRMQMPVFGGGFNSGTSTMQPDVPSQGQQGMDISPEQLEQLEQFRLQMEQLKNQMGTK
jgi:outer membrane lipoprotein-sorting protein